MIEKESAIDIFKREITRIADSEEGTAHFDAEFNASDLGESDRDFYEKYKKGTLEMEEAGNRLKNIEQANGNESQRQLAGYVANKMQERLWER